MQSKTNVLERLLHLMRFSVFVEFFFFLQISAYIPIKMSIFHPVYILLFAFLYFYYLQLMFLLFTAIHTRCRCYSIDSIHFCWFSRLLDQSETELF